MSEAFEVRVFSEQDAVPPAVEAALAEELRNSREAVAGGGWQFACVCGFDGGGRWIGAAHADFGPVNDGPLAHDLVAILERVIVEPEWRCRGVGTALLRRALEAARDAGCQHARCNVRWDDPAAIALYRRCGFALTDVSEPGEGGWYFAVRPL